MSGLEQIRADGALELAQFWVWTGSKLERVGSCQIWSGSDLVEERVGSGAGAGRIGRGFRGGGGGGNQVERRRWEDS